jgi:hypothetical protein
MRRENGEIAERILLVKPKGKKKKGRPRMRRMDGVEKDLRILDVVNKNGMAGERF